MIGAEIAWSRSGAEALRSCYTSLTSREREVMSLVVSGLLNKQVGSKLGISEITVKAHRGKLMRKMNAESLPHLVKMARDCAYLSAKGLILRLAQSSGSIRLCHASPYLNPPREICS